MGCLVGLSHTLQLRFGDPLSVPDVLLLPPIQPRLLLRRAKCARRCHTFLTSDFEFWAMLRKRDDSLCT